MAASTVDEEYEEECEEEVPGLQLTDTVVRAIRTYVPVLAGTLISFLLQKYGVRLDGLGLEAALTAVCVLGWWSLWAFLERKWPWLGWFNGHPKPVKPEPEPEEVPDYHPAPIGTSQLVGMITTLTKTVGELTDLIKNLPEKKTVGWKATVGYEVWPPEKWPAPKQFEYWPGDNWPPGKIWPLPPPPGQAQGPAGPPQSPPPNAPEPPLTDEGEPEVEDVLETSTYIEATPDPEEESGYAIREFHAVDGDPELEEDGD